MIVDGVYNSPTVSYHQFGLRIKGHGQMYLSMSYGSVHELFFHSYGERW